MLSWRQGGTLDAPAQDLNMAVQNVAPGLYCFYNTISTKFYIVDFSQEYLICILPHNPDEDEP
jgi:hypothetical protein